MDVMTPASSSSRQRRRRRRQGRQNFIQTLRNSQASLNKGYV